jgi:hypothetical protein
MSWQRLYHHKNIENSSINWDSSMQNFWSKQSNAIRQDLSHINDEQSLIKQLRINVINQQSQLMIRIRLKISDSLRFELKIFNSKRIFSTRIKDLTSIEIFSSQLKMNSIFIILESWKNVSRDVIIHNIEDCENRVLMIK